MPTSLVSKRLLLPILGVLLALPLARAESQSDAEQAIIDLYNNKQLFDKTKYKTVRSAFAKLFEARRQKDLTAGFGGDIDELNKWLAARPDLKENLFTAIDEHYDRVAPALALFRTLWSKSPEQVEKHPNLAIAVAITWDDPKAVYNYRGHQTRTKSALPDGLIDGPANFDYIVGDKALEALSKFLPWEFLVFVIDHPTPLAERAWAQTYFRTNPGFRSWHKDVPYDNDMLKGEKNKASGLQPKIAGEEYTLANIRKFGGVCAQQADFAARVAKSVGIPAVYCSGESAFRGGHAWWMFVQVTQASADKLSFNLNSDGRFVGFIKDAFYTGNVIDPRTGRKMLDRDMERRLHVAGSDLVGKRQGDLLMRAYPLLAARLQWDVAERVAYLDKTLKVCPMAEEPYLEFAKLVKTSKLQAEHKAIIKTYLSSLQAQFKNYPDFVDRVFIDMLTVYEPADQLKLWQQAVTLFEKAGRPDLLCSARLKITDVLAKQQKFQPAVEGIVTTIYRFPTEGRYVPQLTKKAQEVCGNYKGGNERLAQVYLDLVPKLAVYYRNDDASYTNRIYEQAQTFFTQNQMTAPAAALKARMGKV